MSNALVSRCGALVLAASMLVAGCGSASAQRADRSTAGAAGASAVRGTVANDASRGDRQATRYEVGRFLMQASFGPSDDAVNQVMKRGYSIWVDGQLALPATSHRAYWEAADAAIRLADPTRAGGQDQVWESFWKQAITADDQLRQRAVFALSEIFVISALDGNVGNQPRALAAWLDMLGDKGFSTYRELLESVALHPLMGSYLTHLKNQKADLATGRIPDQNFAREVMQLFSIGLVQLNPDGTPVLVNGRVVETYTPDDVAGLSRVFTGFSWACPAGASTSASNSCFYNGATGGTNSASDPDRYFKPMVGYPQFHSPEAKTFLGVTIPAQSPANPNASLKTALDTLAAHPNVGPFIGRQLIQRLVTSNPSPAYVGAVAAAFNDNGSGQRGDMKAVLRAVLLHPEALVVGNATGKVREPVLRLSAYLRAYPHTSVTGGWKVGNTDSASTALGQTPLRAGSVFNFFRPAYVAPGGAAAAAALVAPEMQLFNETSVAGWVNYMRDNLGSGIGQRGPMVNGVQAPRDLQRDWAPELALATKPAELVRTIADRLTQGQATDAQRSDITTAIGKITIPVLNAGGTNQAAIDTAKRNRVHSAVLLVLASPEFLVQK